MIIRKQYIETKRIYKNSSLGYDWYIDAFYLFGIIPIYISKRKVS